MIIKDILGIENAYLLNGNENALFDSFSTDTRTIKEGDTFIGIKGEFFDGSKYYIDALEKGAKTVVISGIDVTSDILDKYNDRNIIITDNVLAFIIAAAKKRREKLSIPVIAVTGSVGKTTTKNMIADTLKTKYKVLKTEGNLNTDIGVSLTILSIKDEEALVLEMGMSALGEISVLSNIARPTHAVITNIGTSHIGNLGSRENILKAKLEILEGLTGPVIINNDNDLLSKWYKENNDKEIITYGIDTESNYKASNITYNEEGSHYTLNDTLVNLNVYGKHFIYNSLVCFIIADLLNIPKSNVLYVLNNLKLEPNRMEIIKKNDFTIINDTYNSSYDSIYYALEVLNSFKGRKIAVLGDVLELGEFSKKIHEDIGALVSSKNPDILITVGDASSYINEKALSLGYSNKLYHFKSNNEAITCINSIKEKGDTILVKASNAMHFIEIVDALK